MPDDTQPTRRARTCSTCGSDGAPKLGCQSLWHIELRAPAPVLPAPLIGAGEPASPQPTHVTPTTVDGEPPPDLIKVVALKLAEWDGGPPDEVWPAHVEPAADVIGILAEHGWGDLAEVRADVVKAHRLISLGGQEFAVVTRERDEARRSADGWEADATRYARNDLDRQAQIDAMRPVVEAVQSWRGRRLDPEAIHAVLSALERYEHPAVEVSGTTTEPLDTGADEGE